MKSFTGKSSSGRGWALLLALLLGAGMMISACGEEETPAPTTPTPAPPPPPAPAPEPEPTGPATPENLRVTGTTSSSITWSWNTVEGALGYQGQFSTDATFTDADPTFIVVAPATSHTVSNLSGNMTGHFRVRSGTGTSLTDLTYGDWTDGVSGTSAAPPPATALDAPGSVTASDVENNSIVLTWDQVDDAVNYEVQQRAGDATSYVAASCDGEGNVVEETTCVVTDLDSGTAYDFRVRGLPAAADDDHIAGEWATTSGTTAGRGPTTTTVTPGGMGALNIRWHNSGTNNSNITFVWDRQGDVLYETVVLAISGPETTTLEVVANVHVENPCKDVNDSDSNEPSAARYSAASSATSQDVAAADGPGTIRGLCVRPQGSSEASFAWGISPAEEPNKGVHDVDKNVTVEITWADVDLKAAFDYELNLAVDPERPASDNKIDIASSAVTSRAVQAACDAGRHIDSFTPDINLDSRSVSVDSGLKPHTGYLLCIRASNGAGIGTWVVSDTADATGIDDATYATGGFAAETYTRPAAPPRAGAPDVDITEATGSNNDQLGLTWEINTRNVANVPRQGNDFTVVVFSQNLDEPDAPAAKLADCGATAPEDYTIITNTKTDGLSGFEVSVVASESTERVDFTRRVYMCAQADSNGSDTDADKGSGPWTLAGPYNVTKPSTSLSVDSTTLTDAAATVTIKGWNRDWFYKQYTTSAEFATATCTRVSAGQDDLALSGLTASTRYSVKAWATDAACTADKRSLGTTSFSTKASQ